ncbi:Transposon Tf2-9 poly, partial [Paramuricea clavata]
CHMPCDLSEWATPINNTFCPVSRIFLPIWLGYQRLVFGVTGPENVSQVRSFLGLKSHKWKWTEQFLTHYDTTLPVKIAYPSPRRSATGFEYDIEYKNTKEHCNADGLSRLPLPMTEKEDTAVDAADVFHATQLNILPVTSESLKSELTVHQGCILWGMRVVIPSKLQERILRELHDSHLEPKDAIQAKTIEVLRNLFARFGIPEQIVSDNGPQFVSEEFRSFMKSNGVKHITSAPYHPATNGLAERSVQTFKQALRSMEESSKPIQEKLAKFLITYRNTPHSTTGESPAQLMLGRPIRTRLDLVKPNLNRKMVIKQQEQSRKSASAKNRATRQLEVGDMVMARDYRGNLKWRSGKVIERIGPLMYKIEIPSMGEIKSRTRVVCSLRQEDTFCHIRTFVNTGHELWLGITRIRRYIELLF